MNNRESRNERRKKRLKVFKKESIKALALALIIGSIGTGMSYAYFKDEVKVNPDLNITTGTLQTVFLEKNKPIDIKYDDDYKDGTTIKNDKFTIENKGTLNQKLKLNIENYKEHQTLIKNKHLSNIKHSIEFTKIKKDGSRESLDTYVAPFSEFKSKSIIIYHKGIPAVLEPGEKIEGKFALQKNTKDKYDDILCTFDIKVTATQTNDSIKE